MATRHFHQRDGLRAQPPEAERASCKHGGFQREAGACSQSGGLDHGTPVSQQQGEGSSSANAPWLSLLSVLPVPSSRAPACLPRPKVISAIHQKRLCSCDHLRAVGHVLEHVGMSLDELFPANILKGPSGPEQRLQHKISAKTWSYLWNPDAGTCRWDAVQEPAGHRRLILSPDEGGPLYCAYIHLASCGAAIGFQRDELHLNSICIRLAHKRIITRSSLS